MRFSRIVLAILLALGASQAHAADLWRPKGAPSFVDSSGSPIAGKLCYFDAGTTSARTVYKDSGETTPWTQPISLDSAGRLTDPVFVPTGEFKEVFLDDDATTCSDGTTIFTADGLPGALDVDSLSSEFAKPQQPAISKAANYTVLTADLGSVINVNATGGAVTITLPSAVSAGNGGQVAVRKIDSSGNAVAIAVVGGQTIDGASSVSLSAQYDRLTIGSDGANWYTLAGVTNGTITFLKLAASAFDTDGTLTANSDTTLPTQKAVKTYVDTAVSSGIKWKDPVVAASTANVDEDNDIEDGDALDGVTLATGDRVLLKDQSAPAENGVYIVPASGAASRSTDIDQAAEFLGSTMFVAGGTANEGNQYTETATVATVDTDAVAFSLIASGTTYSADGTSLELTGSVFAVKDDGITAAKIATGAVGSDEIGADAVGASEIAADAVGSSEIATSAVGTAEIADGSVASGDLATSVEAKLRDIGEVIVFAGTSCPSQSLEANGSAISRSTYSGLFSALSTRYGVGDGSTTFNLPDYRGYFLRGWDHGAGNDPDAASRTNAGGGSTGDNVGTKQADQYKAHTHSYGTYSSQKNNISGSGANDDMWSGDQGANTGSSGGNETRPKNINVLYCIFAGA